MVDWEFIRERIGEAAERAAPIASRLRADSSEAASSLGTLLTTRKAKAAYVLGIIAAIAIGVLYLSWQLAGPIDTIAYAILFLLGVTFLPVTILFGSPSFTQGMKKIFGKLHFILGQVAFDTGYLVQRRDRWEMCPGSAERVFIDGEWHDIEGGTTNLSVLGWKPFGILRYKDDEAYEEVRVGSDREAASIEEIATTQPQELMHDGGDASTVERAGFTEVSPRRNATTDNEWLIDLKRIYSQGVKKIGDISLIEKAEEIQMRKEAKSGRAGGWEPIIGSVVGLIIGVATGYVLLGGV